MKNAKKIVSFILSLTILLGLSVGCGQNSNADTEIPQTNPTQVQTPTEATTPSPVLSESLQQVYDLGIADMNLLSQAEDICTRAEAAGMLARVHEMQYGQKSVYLYDMVDAFEVDEWSAPVTRFYFAQAVFCSAMEKVFYFPYENWYVWACNCTENDPATHGLMRR